MLEYLYTKRLWLVRVEFLKFGLYCNVLTIVGVDCGEGPPVPIPNTEVVLIGEGKPICYSLFRIFENQHRLSLLGQTVLFCIEKTTC